MQLELDYERELLRAALCHLEAQLLEAAHLRSRRAGQQVSKRQAGTARVVRGLGGRAARRAVVEAERGAVLLEHLLQLALRDAQLALARWLGLGLGLGLGLRFGLGLGLGLGLGSGSGSG